DPFQALTPIPELVLSGPNGEDLLMKAFLSEPFKLPPLPGGYVPPPLMPGGPPPAFAMPPAGYAVPQSFLAAPTPSGTYPALRHPPSGAHPNITAPPGRFGSSPPTGGLPEPPGSPAGFGGNNDPLTGSHLSPGAAQDRLAKSVSERARRAVSTPGHPSGV